MSIHDEVYALIKRNGAMGVNQLSKELNIPLSTMQKYMDKQQSYFKKNNARKWVMPEESVKSDMSAVSDNMGNVIDSQLSSMQALIDTLMSQFKATITLIEAHKPVQHPVAAKLPNIDKRLIELDREVKETEKLFKSYSKNLHEDYRHAVLNLDIMGLKLEKGITYSISDAHPDIADNLLGKTDIMSDETIEMLKLYQKET